MSWSFYDANGKLLQGVLSGSITSAEILDGTIVNADINASAAITYSRLAALADGNILVGNGSNVAVSVNPSGDVDISNAGAFSIAANAVTLAKMDGLARGRIIYGDSNGDPAALALGASGLALKSDGTDLVYGSAGVGLGMVIALGG